jgi:phage/conjugal plasmid C-4 type zinc finger TraR family protein
VDEIDIVTERNLLWTAQCIAEVTKQKKPNSVYECIDCGADIPKARKLLVPHTKHCIECATINERR